MEKTRRQEYSARVVQANRTQLLTIVYEILQEELLEAAMELEKDNIQCFENALSNAQKFLNELMGTLDYRYELSFRLLSIYKYINKVIIRDRLKTEGNQLRECADIVGQLREGFEQIRDQDGSAPLMENVQKVYAGLTYGKNQLAETSVDMTNRRGLYA